MCTKKVGAASWDISSKGFGENSFQSTCEFMGAIKALVGLIGYRLQNKPFILRGDSKSALRWAEKKWYSYIVVGALDNYL